LLIRLKNDKVNNCLIKKITMKRTQIKETTAKVGEKVKLYGWVDTRRDHGKIIFIDLRDRSGLLQVVFTPGIGDFYNTASEIRPEWVVEITGAVKARPDNMINKDLETGTVEVEAEEIKVISKAKTPPFEVNTDGREVKEELRMKYRYLDLRRKRMLKNLENRFSIIQHARNYLTEKGFLEVETPIISKSTPEGARDYLVPARIAPGNFYALPQSPQQYKQMLMVAGIEKYFQVARCFRDEDSRGDRQPEFTQLDMELSFVEQEDILELIENLFLDTVRALYPEKKIKLDENGRIIRMTYKEVMDKYDSDKPDIRDNKNDPNELAFLFVVDFPMFEWKEKEDRWDATHHPFTMPNVENAEDFWKKFNENPGEILAQQYDFVLNGYEIGGGSIRIHDPELLFAVFEAMKNDPQDIKDKFGHLLEAFEYGVPNHGGFACGLDRFIMIMQEEPSIREVFAFAKTGDGKDLLMNSPSGASEEQLKELHIKTDIPEK
jgi:aspartyl-tRNA synthetase